MSYTRDFGEITGRYRPAGQVEHSILRAGTVARYVATGDVTNGQFGLFEWEMPNGAGGSDAATTNGPSHGPATTSTGPERESSGPAIWPTY
jgi:hypothetical protein